MKKIYLLLSLLTNLSFAQNTQTKDDAGARGGNSGFYETYKPSSTYPPGATSFWHLLDVRHTNVTNNFAMQFSGSFYDQTLWFRKTNNNAHRAWSKVVLENPQGNVGIGISNPQNKLDVNGIIHSKEVKVDMEGWADYVFKKEYNLPTLQEVEEHIQEKGHLPNIPSEKEVIENGLSVGENQKLLLQKIEELTLYILQLNKEIQELKKN